MGDAGEGFRGSEAQIMSGGPADLFQQLLRLLWMMAVLDHAGREAAAPGWGERAERIRVAAESLLDDLLTNASLSIIMMMKNK